MINVRIYGSLSLMISILVISMAVGLKYLLSWHLTSFLAVVLATTLAYIPHELMHIAVARRLGCLSTYTLDPVGLVLTLVSSALPVKIIMPGYVIISAPYYDSFTRKKIEAITASAGPLT
ncbi:MAG: site-2 protease family protein, partial [Desulfurococcaceae archaeon]